MLPSTPAGSSPHPEHGTARDTGPGLETGFGPLRRHIEQRRAGGQSTTKKSVECQHDPGRPISTTLLSHRIPKYVDDAIASPTDWEGAGQDQRLLFRRLQRDVAYPLVLRGFSAEEFLNFMPAYTPPPSKEGQRRNVLWEELTHRGRRIRHPQQYEPMVVKAFKYAHEALGQGFIPDEDQPEYIAALTDMWRGLLAAGQIALSPLEAGVLDYVMHQMHARSFLNVTCPLRDVAATLGVNYLRVRRALQRLSDDGVLVCRSRGNAQRRKAGIYCLAPRLPAERTVAIQEKSSSYGTALTLLHQKPQVNTDFGGEGHMKHTNSLRVSCSPTSPSCSKPAASSGSMGMFQRFSGEGVHSVNTDGLDFPKELLIEGPAAIESYYARLWGAWAVLWPGRWPKAPHLPQTELVVMESEDAARNWVGAALIHLGRGKRLSNVLLDAHAGLQLWLGSQIELHEWRQRLNRVQSP